MENLIFTFLIGGGLCLVAQLLIDLTKLTPARILVLYVCTGVALYATGVYDILFDIAGCGASLPLIGFGGSIGRGVKEAIDSSGAVGILTGGLSATSAGISAAIFLSLLIGLIFKGRRKKL